MPTYDYRCSACGHEFEKFQPISSATLKKCPKCGKSKLKRLIGTGAGVIFKGGGFYETDYRSDSYKAAAKADSGGEKSASDKTGTGEGKAVKKDSAAAAESKPATEAKPSSGSKQSKRKSA